jgi:hypothetical protein
MSRIPGAMPLGMLYMALGQKPSGCFAVPGDCADEYGLWPLAMGLFAKGDDHHSQGQRPWRNAQ